MGSTTFASISNLNFIRNHTHSCFDHRRTIRNQRVSVLAHHSRRPIPEHESSAEPGVGVGSAEEERPSTDLVDGSKEENRGGQKHKQPKSRQELRVLAENPVSEQEEKEKWKDQYLFGF
ncbi:hypothetical protein TB2_019554 [Malus domestica]